MYQVPSITPLGFYSQPITVPQFNIPKSKSPHIPPTPTENASEFKSKLSPESVFESNLSKEKKYSVKEKIQKKPGKKAIVVLKRLESNIIRKYQRKLVNVDDQEFRKTRKR